MRSPSRRHPFRLLLRLVAGLLGGLLLIGFLYETRARAREERVLPPIGRRVDIGGRHLLLNCVGTQSPTVILSAGAATPGYAWIPIQRQLARFVQACWYDRAGEGWSDPGPYPLTSGADARDLHALLQRGGVRPPYLLVGHSLGGLDVRVFAGTYPSEVAGVVLVESAHEEEPLRAPATYLGPQPPRLARYPLHLLFTAAARVGLIRVVSPPASSTTPDPDSVAAIVAALRRRPTAVASYSSRGVVAPMSYAEAAAVRSLGELPLIVLTRGRPPSPPRTGADGAGAAYEQTWQHDMQPQLARLSRNGQQVILPCSGHGVPEDAPVAVVEAVREVLHLPHEHTYCPTP